VLKWACTVVAVGAVVGWVGSGWCTLTVWTSGTLVHIQGGQIGAARGQVWSELPTHIALRLRNPSFYGSPRWYWSFRAEVVGDLSTSAGLQMVGVKGQAPFVSIPLWAFFVASAIPAGLLWRGDLRVARYRKSGCCAACGYQRLGIASYSACPECGVIPVE
jgi:hypothetical protein